jgi:hypothetical protein
MCALVLGVARSLGLRFDFLADGDNALIFARKADVGAWRSGMADVCLKMGHEMEIGDVVSDVESVVFGQSKPLCLGKGAWTMVRDPFKTLSHAFTSYRHYGEMRGGRKVLRGVAQCEAALSAGVPVLQEFAHAMLRKLRFVSLPKIGVLEGMYEYQRVSSSWSGWPEAHWRSVSQESRLGFFKSWGVPPDEQIRLEKSFKVDELPGKWDVPLEGLDWGNFEATKANRDWIEQHWQ